MAYAFLPHFGSTWLCETDGSQVNPLARVPGSPQADRKFSTDGGEFGFREQAGKKIGHYRLLAEAPWFECLTPPTVVSPGNVVDDFVIHDGMFIAGGRSKIAESLWVHPPGAEQPWTSIPLPAGLGLRGKSIDALFVRDHTLVAFDNITLPKWILLYELSPKLSALGAEKVALPDHTSYEHVTTVAEGTGVYAVYSSGINHGTVGLFLSLLCSKSLQERVLWSAYVSSRSMPTRRGPALEGISPRAALLQAIQDMAFCGEHLLLAAGSMGVYVSDAAFHRQAKSLDSGVAIGNPFFSVPLQKILNVQRLVCPRGQALGLYVVGLTAAGKLVYEWVGMEQLRLALLAADSSVRFDAS